MAARFQVEVGQFPNDSETSHQTLMGALLGQDRLSCPT
jgi:hypothetical protein